MTDNRIHARLDSIQDTLDAIHSELGDINGRLRQTENTQSALQERVRHVEDDSRRIEKRFDRLEDSIEALRDTVTEALQRQAQLRALNGVGGIMSLIIVVLYVAMQLLGMLP